MKKIACLALPADRLSCLRRGFLPDMRQQAGGRQGSFLPRNDFYISRSLLAVENFIYIVNRL
ncbi:MAG TPA: hypothetical protein ENK14_09590 [Caldithrix sp.]|nr:hypothetical protein [Caldithrix sp.]